MRCGSCTFAENSQSKRKRSGKERSLMGMFMGQVMQKSTKADPKVANKTIN